jgi:hypothetical protein
MRRLALLFVVVLVTAALPPAGAQDPSPVPVQLYLSSATGSIGALSGVETLTPALPSDADDNQRDLTTGAAWYQTQPLAGIPGEASFQGPIQGTTWILATATNPAPIGIRFQSVVSFELRKLLPNGTDVLLGNTTQSFQVQVASPLANATTQVNFTIPAPNTTLGRGETLFLNITDASATPGLLATLAAVYDSTAHPSGFNATLLPVAAGNLQISATTTARPGRPGEAPTYVVSVRNLGDQTDVVALNVTGVPNDWSVSITPAQLTLNGGAAGSALVTVRVPQSAQDGTRHTATVSAQTSLGGPPATLTLTTTASGTRTCPGDQDCDGWTDVQERNYSTNPNDPNSTPENTDSDGDGVSNRAEVDSGTDPFDANDFPGSGDGRRGGTGGARPSPGLLAPLGQPLAQALGVSDATGDLLALVLILLFLAIILLLLWFLLAAYPVKVSLVEAKAVTEPGRGADYAVEVRSRLGRRQEVDLEAAGLPSDWDVRFNKPHLTLEAKQSETVGMLIRPPDGWPAPTKRDFEVRARSRVKPGSFAKAVAKMLIQPRAAEAALPPAETAVPEVEPGYEPAAYEPPPAMAPAPVYAPPPAAPSGQFQVSIRDVRHQPEVPERGGEVTTTCRVDNQAGAGERIRLVLVVNGKVRDEVRVELGPGEGAEAEFHWVAYLARNEVKVVAERA